MQGLLLSLSSGVFGGAIGGGAVEGGGTPMGGISPGGAGGGIEGAAWVVPDVGGGTPNIFCITFFYFELQELWIILPHNFCRMIRRFEGKLQDCSL